MIDSKYIARCQLCGEPMPPGEEMFKYHGYSGDCPKPRLPAPRTVTEERRGLLCHGKLIVIENPETPRWASWWLDTQPVRVTLTYTVPEGR